MSSDAAANTIDSGIAETLPIGGFGWPSTAGPNMSDIKGVHLVEPTNQPLVNFLGFITKHSHSNGNV